MPVQSPGISRTKYEISSVARRSLAGGVAGRFYLLAKMLQILRIAIAGMRPVLSARRPRVRSLVRAHRTMIRPRLRGKRLHAAHVPVADADRCRFAARGVALDGRGGVHEPVGEQA